MINATQLQVGMVIVLKGELFRVESVLHLTPGNKRGMIQTKLRNIQKGISTEYRFRSEDKVEKATISEKEAEYLYNEGENYIFMDTESFEQIYIGKDLLKDVLSYLCPNLLVQIQFYEGRPIGIKLPKTVDLEVVETPPEIKGATASASTKPATLKTGIVVQVPQFVKEGDIVRISTETGQYLERVSS